MIVHYCLQDSPEWYQLRAGKLTSTGARAILASGRTKGSESVGKRDLLFRLVCEQLTGIPQEDGSGFQTDAMLRGKVKQDDALAAYEAVTGSFVRATGFCQHEELAAGCSLDGDVDDMRGVVEVKCPKSATHLAWIRAGGVPAEHMPQITHHLWITGAAWCDFVSFDDRFPQELQLYIARTVAVDTTAYEIVARAFLTDVQRELAAVEAMRARARA